MNVPVGALLRETLRSLCSRPVWAAVAVLAAIVVGGVCGALVVADAEAVQARSRYLTARGWGLVVVSSASGGTFDARACAVAAGVDGVRTAGGVGAAREVGALGMAAGLALTPVTPGVVDVVWPGARYDQAAAGLLTPGFVTLSGLGAGTVHVDAGGALVPLPVDAIAGAGRYPGLDGGVLTVHGDLAEAATCLADVPGEDAERLALDVAAAAVSYGVVAAPVLPPAEAAPTPQDLVHEHRSRGYPLLVGSFLAVLGAMRLLRARRDRAVYRLLDLGRGDLWLMGLVDHLICLAIPATSTFAVVLLDAERRGVPTAVLGRLDLALVLAATAVVGLGCATLCATGRNRHQFAPGA